ncbi:MAG: molybdopterin-synthase adenylyltransferase MoeB [Pseudomonadota bacterium]
MNEEQRERYLRHILLKEVGGQGQQKLLAARVLVVGAGGLGAPIIQYLTAAGVGVIGIADPDRVALSNLQRQVIYAGRDIGVAKTSAAAAYAKALNPGIDIVQHPHTINAENAARIVSDYDYIIEGVDNFKTRFILNKICIDARKPLISAAVGRFEGQLAVFRPFDNPGRAPCYRCFVPTEPPRDQQLNCEEEGVLGTVTGVIGTLAAMETLKQILSLGEGLAGKLLIYDGLAARFRTVALSADPSCPDCQPQKANQDN